MSYVELKGPNVIVLIVPLPISPSPRSYHQTNTPTYELHIDCDVRSWTTLPELITKSREFIFMTSLAWD